MTAADVAELDAMIAAPHYHELLLENDSVRVLDTRLAPGERTPVHTHALPAALYVMSWSDFLRRDVETSSSIRASGTANGQSASLFGCPRSLPIL